MQREKQKGKQNRVQDNTKKITKKKLAIQFDESERKQIQNNIQSSHLKNMFRSKKKRNAAHKKKCEEQEKKEFRKIKNERKNEKLKLARDLGLEMKQQREDAEKYMNEKRKNEVEVINTEQNDLTITTKYL